MNNYTFKEFVINTEKQYANSEIFAIYNNPYSTMKVRDISLVTGKSIGEIYRIVHEYGQTNRQNRNKHLVFNYFDNGMNVKSIAELTGYSEGGVRRILRQEGRL